MAGLALGCFVLYLALAVARQMVLHKRRTGLTGFRGVSGRPGSVEWLGQVLFACVLGPGFVAPMLDLAGIAEPVAALDGWTTHALGVILYGLGLAGTLIAQNAMGASWRIGVKDSEKTNLVTTGPFALIRNPIFAAMIPAFLGLVLMVPSVVALASFVALVAAVEMQVRFVEEPYLLRTHGERYAGYASRVGRLAPGIGRLRT